MNGGKVSVSEFGRPGSATEMDRWQAFTAMKELWAGTLGFEL